MASFSSKRIMLFMRNKRRFPSRCSRRRIVGAIILVVMVLWTKTALDPAKDASLDASLYTFSTGILLPRRLTGDTFYMLPSGKAKGVLLFFHGCQHGGVDLFFLPEDRLVAADALGKGLAVVSFQSLNRASGCWSQRDVSNVMSTIQLFFKQTQLPAHLPRMGMGASSGASFLYQYHKTLGLASMALYIPPIGRAPPAIAHDWPATALVHMPRDQRTAAAVRDHARVLETARIPTLVLQVDPHPFSFDQYDGVCKRRLPELGQPHCHKMKELIDQSYRDVLLDRNGTVLAAHSAGAWSPLLQELDLDNPDLHSEGFDYKGYPASFSGHSWPWASVKEEIAVCFGYHEMTAEHSPIVLDFLIKYAKKPK